MNDMTLASPKRFCFCTLAVGNTYRTMALDLASDLQQYAPFTKLIVLTDQASVFQSCSNVVAINYTPKSIYLYYDKILVVQEALKLYEACVFADADIRIVAPVAEDLLFLPGITAYSSYSIQKHYHKTRSKDDSSLLSTNMGIAESVAKKLGVNREEGRFLWEYFFYIVRDEKTQELLQLWRRIGIYYELRDRHGGEGEALGLAALKLGVPLNHDYEKSIDFFKYKDELYKITKGRSQPETRREYMERFKSLRYPQRSWLMKVKGKILAEIGVKKRYLNLLLTAFQEDFDFYFR